MTQVLGPERDVGQGIAADKAESGDRAIVALLRDPKVSEHVDLVITRRGNSYEVWAQRGFIRFRRVVRDGALAFEILEEIGENPVHRQSPSAVASCAEEVAAACASGWPTADPNTAYIEPAQLTYPWAYERIAQLFDSPHAPDIVVSPKCFAFGLQPGQHGALDCVQSRAPLAFSGPGVRPGRYPVAARHVDIAPTICRLMGFPFVDGRDATGRCASERGVADDVYLARQDGRVLEELLAPVGASRPERTYLILFDGLSHAELMHLLANDDPGVKNLRRVLARAALFSHGSTVNFPSITWPSHSTILTGAWCGHHDIVNPAYYVRSKVESVAPQAQAMLTEGFLGDEVETLYEVFNRVLGGETVTAAIHEPQGRGAQHAPLEQRLVMSKARLKALSPELLAEIDERHARAGHEDVHREAQLDARGLAQALALFDSGDHPPPAFVAHEFAMTDGAGHSYGPHGAGLRAAVAETDHRLGRVLDLLDRKGLFESTLFVFTSDHGMAAQNVALGANPARHLERIGMKVVTHEPMVWLREMALTVVAASDRRTARIEVYDHDADTQGERRPVPGADVLVSVHGADDDQATSIRIKTNEAGIAGFSIPADLPLARFAVSVRHDDFNPRHIRLDGTSLGIDLRQELYGNRSD